MGQGKHPVQKRQRCFQPKILVRKLSCSVIFKASAAKGVDLKLPRCTYRHFRQEPLCPARLDCTKLVSNPSGTSWTWTGWHGPHSFQGQGAPLFNECQVHWNIATVHCSLTCVESSKDDITHHWPKSTEPWAKQPRGCRSWEWQSVYNPFHFSSMLLPHLAAMWCVMCHILDIVQGTMNTCRNDDLPPMAQNGFSCFCPPWTATSCWIARSLLAEQRAEISIKLGYIQAPQSAKDSGAHTTRLTVLHGSDLRCHCHPMALFVLFSKI